jgi:hypothetical protein
LNNLFAIVKAGGAIKLMSADGQKQHGSAILKEVIPSAGPSFLRKLQSGLRINLISGIDTTGM